MVYNAAICIEAQQNVLYKYTQVVQIDYK